MVTGVGNATLYQENLVKGYLTIPKKPGVRPISIPHPLGWGGRTQFDFFSYWPQFGTLCFWLRLVCILDILSESNQCSICRCLHARLQLQSSFLLFLLLRIPMPL